MNKQIFSMIIALAIIAATFASCEKNEADDEQLEDSELLKLMYSTDYMYPDGFYHEDLDDMWSTYYENTVSIKPIAEREHIWIELHTTNKEEAKNWSNLSNEYSSVNRILIQEKETEKYFEFFRVNEARESDVLLSRVYRSDYFIPYFDRFNYFYNFDLLVENKTIGIYNGIVSLEKIKEFVEYLWGTGNVVGFPEKVLESKISEKKDKYEHYIQSIRMTGGDWGLHDMIYVYRNKFELDKNTKVLTLVERKSIKEIKGNYHEGW